MTQPYRTSTQSTEASLTKEVETNDTFVEVIYCDETNAVVSKKREFLGKPYAGRWYDDMNIETDGRPGEARFRDWRNAMFTNQCASFDDLLIPMHRVLNIKVSTVKRTAIVDVEISPLKRRKSI